MLGGDVVPGRVPFPQYFLAGIAATGIMLSSFQALGTSIATERETGQLERLQLLGTPPVAYFAGKAGQVLVTDRRPSWRCCCRWRATPTTCRCRSTSRTG